ncbi:nuclear transport factor 2 family protein [Streptomyces roseirectus]|uniref:Nuclear transport factor 2 family protein n=1 Tax=Streptomyces roseirectus TaxID=2768066 RepID=A0A7H0IR12_9ACTN|nr:nuclear transport factor 2 family protein [Streptomyces roseirectus]QNP75228.1 nuclear transport factor 2 family protein [Streptomyces roseirectus]
MADGADLAARIDALSARVRELEAIRELTRLRNSFHHCLNDRDWAGLGALFAQDAHLDYGSFGGARGRVAIQEYYSALLPKMVELQRASEVLLKNFNQVHQVVVDGDRATGACFFEEYVRFDKEDVVHQSVGRFADSYVFTDGRWLFERVELEHYWVVPENKEWRWPW